MIALGVGLAVLAACCYATAAVLQHRAVRAVAANGVRATDFRTLVRTPGWLLGTLAVAGGAALHVVSLSIAPLLVVQPIGVLAIGLTTLAHGRPTRSTMLAVLVTAAGVGMFVLVAAPHANPAAVPELAAGTVLPVTGVVLAGLVVAAMSARGWSRCPLFATAAGVAYGTVSVLARVLAQRIRLVGLHGMPLVPTIVAVAGCVVAISAGALCVHQAFASGGPDTVMACQTVVDPLIGVLFGVFLFHESVGAGPSTVLGELAAGALAAAGVVALARRNETNPPTKEPDMDRPLRIVIGADTYPPDINGAARFTQRLANGLAGRDHDVHVLCPSDTGPAGTAVVDGVTVHRLPARRTPFHETFRVCLPWQARRGAGALLDELRPDLVHVQAHFSVGRALVHSAADRRVPIVATNHFMPQNLEHHLRMPTVLRASAARLAWRDLARVFEPAAIVTAPTATAVRMLREHGFGGRVIPVSCGVDVSHFHAFLPDETGPILFVGRLDEEKHVHELLHALALLPGRTLELVGDGACRPALTALAHRLGIADRVTFHGFVSDDELVAAYRRATVFCMPGVAELQSIATMEAMAAGRPVVAADAVALPHLVQPGLNGWLYPPGDVATLAEKIADVFEPGRAAAMGTASRDMIANHDFHYTLYLFETLYQVAAGVRDSVELGPPTAVGLSDSYRETCEPA